MDQSVATQDQVLAFLADSATHGAPVRRIDTHAASVFLAGDRAFKVKRAVRFPFLDYSTLERRQAACETELAINRPLAPDIYRRVIPITREADGRLALDGRGAIVEWAVEMRRFDETQTLDHVAGRGEIDARLADALGQAVAKAHEAAPAIAEGPWIAALASFLDQNATAFRETPELFPPREAAALDRASRAALARHQPLLVARGGLGLVRRGHGDLHLGNIVLIDGRPVLFDAIEFDPLVAAGDVLYDLAFLLMDLTERALLAAANTVLNRYLAQTRRPEDLDGLAAMPFFLSLRAAIRAKVTAARADRAGQGAREGITQSARRYFSLACELIAPPPPVLVAIGGLSGTGKSALARALAPALRPAPGAVVLRSDFERKALFGLAETDRLPPEGYAQAVTASVYSILADKAWRVAGAGHSVIADAVFARAEERAAIAQAAQAARTTFYGLFLTADLATRVARIGARAHDASDADAAVARQQERYELSALDWTMIDASGSPAETLARARAAIA
jgi:aminoglycoside phosphotransferase family enzyme/predicted kinase